MPLTPRAGVRALTVVALWICAVSGAGCEATSMSAGHVPIPIVLGPVRCIGCEPTPPPAGSVRVTDEAQFTYMIASGPTMTSSFREHGQSSLARKAYAAVGKSCGGELRVLRLHAAAFGVFAIFFGMYKGQVEVTAIHTVMPPETCLPSAAAPDETSGQGPK